jgi:large subunit ribosomal protein L6
MSRVGKLPVKIPEKVKVSVDGYVIKVEGPRARCPSPSTPP